MMLWELVDGALPKWAAMSWYWTSLHFPQHFSPVSVPLPCAVQHYSSMHVNLRAWV